MPYHRMKIEDQYEALWEKGYSTEKAGRNANTPSAGKRGGKTRLYEGWIKNKLYEQAKSVRVDEIIIIYTLKMSI